MKSRLLGAFSASLFAMTSIGTAHAVAISGQGTWESALQGDVGASAVPVPASAWLFGSGLLGLVGVSRKRRRKFPSASAFALTSILFSTSSYAVTTTYTDQAAFLAALPGPASTLDFDSLAAGTTITNGDTVGGITFNYNFGGVSMVVTDGNQFGGGGPFATTSGSNFLGTDDSDLFLDGDDFDLSFAPVNAIGMFFITADEMFDDDITLSAGGTSVGLSVAAAGADLGDGGIPYFLGIIDDTNPFTTANITTIGGGFFLYNVDDIVTAVPLPGALWLFGSGLVGLLAHRRGN